MKIVHLEGMCVKCKVPLTKTMPFEDYVKGESLVCPTHGTPISFKITRIEEN